MVRDRPLSIAPKAPATPVKNPIAMLVPAAFGALTPSRSMAGKRMVPSSSPTTPESAPRAAPIVISTTSSITQS